MMSSSVDIPAYMLLYKSLDGALRLQISDADFIP